MFAFTCIFRFLLAVVLLLPAFQAFPAGLSELDSLRQLLSTTLHDTDRVKIHNNISRKLFRKDQELSRQHADSAMTLATKIDYPMGIAMAYKNIGSGYYVKGNYEKALEQWKYCRVYTDRTGDSSQMANALVNIGVAYKKLGFYDKSIHFYMESLEISEKILDSLKMAMAYVNLGTLNSAQNDYKQALHYLEKGKAIYALKDRKRELAATSNNMGIIFEKQEAYEKAISLYEQTLSLYENLDDEWGMALGNNNVGLILFKMGKIEEALEKLLLTLSIRKKLGDEYGIASTMINIGNCYHELGAYEKAIDYFKDSQRRSEKMGTRQLSRSCYEALLESYRFKKDYQKALKYHHLLVAVKDSMFNEESNKQIQEMQTRYEAEQKEKEIVLLTKEKELHTANLQQQEAELTWQRIVLVIALVGLVMILILAFLIYNRYKLKQQTNERLGAQNREINEQNKKITDSIKYAQKIQEAILPPREIMEPAFRDSFVLYIPKDIVSGDFYWYCEVPSKQEAGPDGNVLSLFAAVDCTGHGVPGAFMSIIGYNLLNKAVNEHGLTQPAGILDFLNKEVAAILSQDDPAGRVKDGMDIALCCLDRKQGRLQFAGAYNPLYIVRKGELMITKADRFPIGYFWKGRKQSFTNHEISLEPGDQLYLFSDGLIDQFGGPSAKKFKSTQFKELLLENHALPMPRQREILNDQFKNWKGGQVQTDDVLVMGVAI